MNKNRVIEELTNLLSRGLRHKIGSIVNAEDLYASKYAKDADSFFQEAEKVSQQVHWNAEDHIKIREILKKKLYDELVKKEFINLRKFEIIDEQIDDILKKLL